jgi:hypothetical protein
MILTGGGRIIRRKICPSVTLCTTDLTWTDPGSNPNLPGEMLGPNHRIKTDVKSKLNIKKHTFCLTENTAGLHYNVTRLMRRKKWCQFRTVQSVPCELIYKRHQHQQMHSSIYCVFYFKKTHTCCGCVFLEGWC